MTDERHTNLNADERIQETIRSAGDVRADTAFRERLKREFVDGTLSESAAPQEKPRTRRLSPWWWAMAPAAAAVLLFALLWPRPASTWDVQAVVGEGRVEIGGQTLASDEPTLVARVLEAGGRVHVLEGAALDLRLDDRLLLGLDEGTDVTLPVLTERDAPGPLVAEVHHGELRIMTGPGFPGNELHILTPESRTEIVGTVVSVYKYDGYTCVCVLEGTARIGADEDQLEDVPEGMLKIMFDDGSPPFTMEISPDHGEDLQEFVERSRGVFSPRE